MKHPRLERVLYLLCMIMGIIALVLSGLLHNPVLILASLAFIGFVRQTPSQPTT